MNPDAAQDWLNSMLEVAIGMYVFFVGLPALMYRTSISRELREIGGVPMNSWRDAFRAPSLIIFFIVFLVFVHLFCTEVSTLIWIPAWFDNLRWFDGLPINRLTCFNQVGRNSGCSLFSASVVLIVALLFVGFLVSSFRFTATKQGSLKIIAGNLSAKIIALCEKDEWLPETKEMDTWRLIEVFGTYTTPGSQRQIWLKCVEEIVMHLAGLPMTRINIKRLKLSIKMLNDVAGDPHLLPFENVKDTINIYRTLLSKLKEKSRKKESDQLIECYAVISQSLLGFANTAIRDETSAILPTVISTLKLMPNNSSSLFDIGIIALRYGKYEILAHSFNEIIGKGENDETRFHNFWGIYAALYLKDGAFRDLAEQMRKNSGFRFVNRRILREAYRYHFANAHLDVADCLYKLIAQHSKKDTK